jgi:IS30 family transposase
MKTCSICNSEHRSLIDARLLRGVSGYKISEELRQQHGVRISKSAIYRHRKNCVLLPRRNNVYSMLFETGNRRLARSIERTRKIIEILEYCRCDSTISRSLRRKGLVWVCGLCEGWIPYNIGLVLKRRFKRLQPRRHVLVATARSY